MDAGIHAREWIAPATALYLINQLVEHSSEHQDLLQDMDWYILPLVNPDGYEYSQTKVNSVHTVHASLLVQVTRFLVRFRFFCFERKSIQIPCAGSILAQKPRCNARYLVCLVVEHALRAGCRCEPQLRLPLDA